MLDLYAGHIEMTPLQPAVVATQSLTTGLIVSLLAAAVAGVVGIAVRQSGLIDHFPRSSEGIALAVGATFIAAFVITVALDAGSDEPAEPPPTTTESSLQTTAPAPPASTTTTPPPRAPIAKGLSSFSNIDTDGGGDVADTVDINGRTGLPDAALIDVSPAYPRAYVKVPTNKQYATLKAVVGLPADVQCPENHAAVSVQDQDGAVLWPPGGGDQEVSTSDSADIEVDVSQATQVKFTARGLVSQGVGNECGGDTTAAFGDVKFIPAS